MNSEQLKASFQEFRSTKNIDKPTVIRMLDDVLRSLIQGKFGTTDHFDVVINPNKGDLQIWRSRKIVDDNSEDIWEDDKISLSEARKIEPDFEVGEEVAAQVPLATFDRRSVKQALRLLVQKRQELEASQLHERYKKHIGQIVNAEVYHVLRREVVLYDDKRNELILPTAAQIPGERFKKGQYVRALIDRVRLDKNNLQIILSRTSPLFLEKLLESEIPEVFDGLVSIKKVVRKPGKRAKVAVTSYDDRIDPVGACIGVKGTRIHSVMRQICNEQIDIINYTENLELYISRALSPAKVLKIQQGTDGITVYLKPDQVPLAIGAGGQTVNLASELIGQPIQVHRALYDDVYLEEFAGQIDPMVIDKLRQANLDTAKSVLAVAKHELVERTGLQAQTIDIVYQVLEKELAA